MSIYLGLFLIASLSNAASIPPSGCTLMSPLPTGVICGENGNAPITKGTYTQKLPTLTECENFALRRQPHPQYFRYSNELHLCRYSYSLLSNFTSDPTSSSVFYDSACFDCPAVCPEKVGQNLFDNGGFELSAHYLAPWLPGQNKANNKIVSGGAYGKSSKAIQLADTSNLIQKFEYCPGVIYQWGYDYKGTNVPSTGIFLEPSFDFNVFTTLTILENDVWSTYTDLKYYRPTSDAFSMLVQSLPSPQTVELDNFKLIPTSYTLDAKPGAVNLLVNGGFETGSANPWGLQYSSYDGTTLGIVSPGINSSYGLQFTYNQDAGVPDFTLYQNIQPNGTQIIAGTPYLLTFDYNSNNPNLILNVRYQISPAEGIDYNSTAPYVVQQSSQVITVQNGTVQDVFLGQANANYIQIDLSVFGGYPQNGGVFLMDNFSLKELAPPA